MVISYSSPILWANIWVLAPGRAGALRSPGDACWMEWVEEDLPRERSQSVEHGQAFEKSDGAPLLPRCRLADGWAVGH